MEVYRGSVTRRFTPTGVGTTGKQAAPAAVMAVHPHGRGDDTEQASSWRGESGSPPRAWGRRPGQRASGRRCRFTPTGVGTTSRWSWRTSGRPVHPHGRGDDAVMFSCMRFISGSPPRAWGRLPFRVPPLEETRFTPTGVGTTQRIKGQRGLRGGSPPRAWGRPILD